MVRFSERLFEELDDIKMAVFEVESVFKPESEVEQFFLSEAGEVIEDLNEGLIQLVDKVVDSFLGQQEILDFLHLSSHAVLVLVEHKHVLVSRLVEYLQPVVTDIEVRLFLASLIDEYELLVEILYDLVQLSAVFDEFEYLLVDLADVAGPSDRFENAHIAGQLLDEFLYAICLLFPVLHIEVQLLNELLEDLLVHAALEDLQQPL